MSERPQVDLKSFAALLFEWLIIVLALAFAVRLASWWSYVTAFAVIAMRQHALLMLYHDAVHGLLARDRRLNDFLVNLFVGIPHMLPVEVYRPLHMAHHRHLGTDEDPERVFLYAGQPWSYRPLDTIRLLRQLMGDLFLVNGIRTMSAWRQAGGKISLAAATILLGAIWVIGLAVFVWYAPSTAAKTILMWFAALFTLTNLLQKIRSFAEHSGGPGATPGWNDWTYTWRPGLLGRLTIWPYNINMHQEHHSEPRAPWHQLPRLARTSARKPGGELWRLLYGREAAGRRR